MLSPNNFHDFIYFSDQLKVLEEEAKDYAIAKDDLEARLESYNASIKQKTEIINELEKLIQELQKELDETNTNISSMEIRSAKEAKHREMVLSGDIKVSTEAQIYTLKEVLSELN